jgi:acylphosphatase
LFEFVVVIVPKRKVREYNLIGVNGSILELRDTRGFRNFVKTEADKLKLSGWVKKVPRCDVEIVVCGDEASLERFNDFIVSCENISICSVATMKNSDKLIVGKEFVVLKSDRRNCKTGQYSDKELDIVSVSVASADREIFGGSTHSSK